MIPAQRIELSPDCWLSYLPGFIAASAADALYAELARDTPWDTNVDGPTARPRRTYWIGELSYAYSGVVHHPATWTPSLLDVRRDLERLCFGDSAGQFQGVLLNLYRNGVDTVGMHADNEPTIEPGSPIASISLGAERTFALVPRKKRIAPDRPRVELRLGHGSCLVMGGWTQRDWRHGVPPEPEVTDARINLTFRNYVAGPAAIRGACATVGERV